MSFSSDSDAVKVADGSLNMEAIAGGAQRPQSPRMYETAQDSQIIYDNFTIVVVRRPWQPDMRGLLTSVNPMSVYCPSGGHTSVTRSSK